jgi:hypothetical protein
MSGPLSVISESLFFKERLKVLKTFNLSGSIDFKKKNFTEECKVSLHEMPQSEGAREPCTPLFGQTLS